MKKLLEIIAVSIAFSVGAYFSALGMELEPQYKLLAGLIIGYAFCCLMRD